MSFQKSVKDGEVLIRSAISAAASNPGTAAVAAVAAVGAVSLGKRVIEASKYVDIDAHAASHSAYGALRGCGAPDKRIGKKSARRHGGDLVAETLSAHGVEAVFTLSGGHISPILVGCEDIGIKVVDVRHEVSTVFAADAVARSTGNIGVAIVTAGPGVTNTITAIKNAQMAQSPVLLIGGAAITLLKGRGSLQDIDQISVLRPITKWATSCNSAAAIVSTLEEAMNVARSGVPGPVFVEFPIDVLYPEDVTRREATRFVPPPPGPLRGPPLRKVWDMATGAAVDFVMWRLYGGAFGPRARDPRPLPVIAPVAFDSEISAVARVLARSKRPVIMIGSQAMIDPKRSATLRAAAAALGAPVWLSSAARGLLGGAGAGVQYRHARSKSLKEADFVLLAGVVMDFRLGYGMAITPRAKLASVNRCPDGLNLNSGLRRIDHPVLADPCDFVIRLAQEHARIVGTAGPERFSEWHATVAAREAAREAEIDASADAEAPAGSDGLVNPIAFCRALDRAVADTDILVADGGDFVGTAAYTVRPRRAAGWLDPGAFGTLGVGGGFALGAKVCAPDPENVVWIIYGDGSSGYSIAEFDTYLRHGLPVVAVVGNDAGWTQILREQAKIFNSSVACDLEYTAYERVAEGFGGEPFVIHDMADAAGVLAKARQAAIAGKAALVNVHIAKSNFRDGSISV